MPPRDAKRRRLLFDDLDREYNSLPSSLHVRYRHTDISQSYALDQPFSLEFERQKASFRLKAAWDDICRKYGRDFGNETDVVDIITGEIVEDHGHLSGMGGVGSTDVWRPKRRYRKRNKDGILQEHKLSVDCDGDTSEYEEGLGDEQDDEYSYDLDSAKNLSDEDGQEYETDRSDELLSAPATSVIYSSSPRKHSPARRNIARSCGDSQALVSSPPPHTRCHSASSSPEPYEDSENARSKKVHELDLLIQSWSTQVLIETGVKDENAVSNMQSKECDLSNVPTQRNLSYEQIWNDDHKSSTYTSIQSPAPAPSLAPSHNAKQEDDGVEDDGVEDDGVEPSGQVLECGMEGYHCGRNFCFSCM
ncbi:uncharacterized protein V1513DRAFT_453619 [Lipomyces chichibuensis]|uniref:uncharacterized protein n=1 Tax=Lipomyces chichibuensis TaxID=1546026 RepID=UPI003342F4F4